MWDIKQGMKCSVFMAPLTKCLLLVVSFQSYYLMRAFVHQSD